MSAFADTSFIGSLYLADANSEKANAGFADLVRPVLISSLGELELINALQLYVFRKEILEGVFRAAVASFRSDVASGVIEVKPISDAVYAKAMQLSTLWTAKFGTPSLDILQVASAIVLEVDTFMTFDDRQKRLAEAAGLACR